MEKIAGVTWNFRIPVSLYREINSFLYRTDSMKLLKCSRLFQDVRKESMVITLKDEAIEQFLQDEAFRNQILNTIQDPGMQISYFFSNYNPDLLQQVALSPVMKFRFIQYCSYDLDEIPEWKTLLTTWKEIELYNNDDIKELSHLESIFRLKLNDYSVLSKISNASSLRDLSLDSCPIQDVSSFSRLTKLFITDCHSFTDVSPLQNIYHLTIRRCLGIKDISSLTKNHFLSVCGCDNISIYEAALRFAKHLETNLIQTESDCLLLENIVSLKMKNVNFSDSALQQFILPERNQEKLRSMEIIRSSIQHVFSLSFLTRLTLVQCPRITNLEGLSDRLRVIELIDCKHLMDISALRRISSSSSSTTTSERIRRSIHVKECHQIRDFSSVQDWYHVTIEDCFGFTNVTDVVSVHHLSIIGYNYLTSYKELSNLPRLEINACKSFTSLEGLERIPNLEILHCNYLPIDHLGFGIHQRLVLSNYYFQILYESFPDYFQDYEIYSDNLETRKDLEGNEIDDYGEIEKEIRILLRKSSSIE